MAGATRIRSALWPRRVCGIGLSSSHSEVCTGSLARAENVVRPTKCSAPAVITGTTCAPASTSRRQTSMALYAAIPPVIPRTMRLPASADGATALIGSQRRRGAQWSGAGSGDDLAVAGSSLGVDAAWAASSASSGSSVRTILSAAISSKLMLSGLRAADGTCGGTMWPRPSPSWLKYELICRARRAANVTRLNFESTRSRSSSIGGFIIVSYVRVVVMRSSVRPVGNPTWQEPPNGGGR